MSPTWLLVYYCVLVAMASMTGGWLPTLIRMTHLRTQLLMSFVSGLMLGIASFHLLPHSTEILGSSIRASQFMLGGVIAMFLLLRAFHVHSHDGNVATLPTASLPPPGESACVAHSHDHVHQQLPIHSEPALPKQSSGLEWIGMLFGLGLHTMMDGVALAASVAADAGGGSWLGLAGLGTFLAVALHKPLDAFSIGSVMSKGGWSLRERSIVNFCFSLACPLGALLFWLGAATLAVESNLIIGGGLAVSAGFFICIALADLLPEVHFHDHDRGKLTFALFLGIVLALGIENLPGHEHGVSEHGVSEHEGHDHSSEPHDH